MTYTVAWKPAAERHLTEVWLNASDRAAVAAAANRIDATLRADPHATGESRAAWARIILERPLGVWVEIHDEDRIVAVIAVWRIS